MNQLSIPLNDKIAHTLSQLRTEHENLLHQQLALLKRTYSVEGQIVSEGDGGAPQNTTSPILVISDSAGHSIHGSIVTSGDGTARVCRQ